MSSQGRPGRGARRTGSAGNGTGGTRRQRVERARQERDDGHLDTTANGRYRARRERNFELPRAVRDELRAVTDGRIAADLERRMTNAAQAYERDRYKEALQAIKPVVDQAPESAAARELYGLTLYRLGRWRQAAKELRLVHELTGSLDQHPVVADCERALGHLDQVTKLWDEMRREGVDKEVLVEGRLVMAGALADAGQLDHAIELLQPAAKAHRKQADVPLLREWYALADLYESAGDLPRARELFHRIALQAPDLFDAPERLRAIR
jgi:tetratricopeptide (TPR) repeat protein